MPACYRRRAVRRDLAAECCDYRGRVHGRCLLAMACRVAGWSRYSGQVESGRSPESATNPGPPPVRRLVTIYQVVGDWIIEGSTVQERAMGRIVGGTSSQSFRAATVEPRPCVRCPTHSLLYRRLREGLVINDIAEGAGGVSSIGAVGADHVCIDRTHDVRCPD